MEGGNGLSWISCLSHGNQHKEEFSGLFLDKEYRSSMERM